MFSGGEKMSRRPLPFVVAVSLFAPVSLLAVAGCTSAPAASAGCRGTLADRAYIVSKNNDEVHVIDLSCMEMMGKVTTGARASHMLELNADFTKGYVDSEESNETVVFDAATLTVTKRLATPRHPTHLSLTRDGKYFAVMAELDNAVYFIDTATDTIARTLPGFMTPHFARMSLDGRYAYVANLGAHHLTRVDLTSLSIDGTIALDGFDDKSAAPDEGGFADAQIDQQTGILYAAHRETGRVLVYDTVNRQKLPELTVGTRPWIVYAEHPFHLGAQAKLVPNFVDQSASVIAADATSVLGALPFADEESYGVNYSPLAPNRAFIMNRAKQQIAVADTAKMQLAGTIDVGGTTETASTSADGKYIVATVSSANRVVIIDAATQSIVKTFDNVGSYPWSVTIPRGQNYCH
jgi:DNA-binding beta-propeller fold protein YncE